MTGYRCLRNAAGRLAGVFASAGLLSVAFPPQDRGPLVLIALVPLLLAVRNTRLTVGLLAGPVVMLVMGGVYELGWMGPPILERPLPRNALAACVIFGLGLSLPLGIAATGRWTMKRLVVIAAAAVCGEGLLLLLLPGHIALALYREPLALSIASVGGIWLVSLLIWWVNLALAVWITERTRRAGTAAVAIFPVIGGLWLLSLINPSSTDESIQVAAIQEATAESIEEWTALHRRASTPVNGEIPDMVIWPELSATAIARGGRTAPLIDLAAQPGIAPFVTSYPDAARPMPHNTASVFSGSGESARYFKRHPFAEEVNIHAPGEDPVTVEVGGVVYGLAICFDSCFPASMRSTATHPGPAGTRPQIILLPNLDPPDHTGFIQGIHAAFTPFRAAETGLPIVRADITARSMIVEARGDILAEAGEGTAEIIRADLPLGGAGAPLAMAAGDRVFYLCAVIVLMAAIRGGLRPRRSPG